MSVSCPCLVLSGFSGKSCPMSVYCPDSVLIFCQMSVCREFSCLDSARSPDSVRILEKKSCPMSVWLAGQGLELSGLPLSLSADFCLQGSLITSQNFFLIIFSGKILPKSKKPKYMNSSELVVFKNGYLFFIKQFLDEGIWLVCMLLRRNIQPEIGHYRYFLTFMLLLIKSYLRRFWKISHW